MAKERILLFDFAPETGLAVRLSTILQQELSIDLVQGDRHIDRRAPRQEPQVLLIAGSRTSLEELKAALKKLRQSWPLTPVMVALEAATNQCVFDLLECGASDFITCPYSPDEVLAKIRRLTGENVRSPSVPDDVREALFLRQFVGASPVFLAEVNKIGFAARSEATVLITGETGVGKDLVARGIHYLSRRVGKPFVPVNCGAIPGDLFENELFGHEPGAFTGASTSQTGLIEEADGGSLFLDEVDSLPMTAQVKLLRFLQEKEYRRLGSTKTRRCDVRIITAMNTSPEAAVRSGRLRQDLYYRLNVIVLLLPPLRDRCDDIPQLAQHFLARYCGEMQKMVTGFSEKAMAQLMRYSWPGNVRELEHTIERAVIFARNGCLEPEDLVLPKLAGTEMQESFRALKARAVAQFERNYITGLLAENHRNISHAARAAQKNRRAFFQLMRKHGIPADPIRTERA
jgi:two-component system response regulator GlrR